jgi:hypothetical protein
VIVPCRVLSCVIVRIGWVRAQATRAVVAAEGGHQAKRVAFKTCSKTGIASSFWSSGHSCIPESFESSTPAIVNPLLVARLARDREKRTNSGLFG